MTKSIEEIYGEHCIQHIKSVDKYDEIKLGDSRVLSPSNWIKSKMHAVGDSINYKHSDDGTPDFGNDGYTYLLQYQFNELDESQMLDNFFFKSNEDRESFEQANVECGVEYFLAAQSYDEHLYQLCMMIRGDLFSNNQNVWNLAGFFACQVHSDWHLVRKTYLCVLKQKSRAFQQGLVELTGRTINDMRSAMVDTSFENDELEYWAEKYLVIENKPNLLVAVTFHATGNANSAVAGKASNEYGVDMITTTAIFVENPRRKHLFILGADATSQEAFHRVVVLHPRGFPLLPRQVERQSGWINFEAIIDVFLLVHMAFCSALTFALLAIFTGNTVPSPYTAHSNSTSAIFVRKVLD
ncbi:uncharacterized protein PITG_13949 [Phytophthora infestans T30-4]|uniref:Uncharacterized protein n=1 Tax=Phytophthora infestans (strain T30-4) TaxID=403677 RepID=D0NN63_PHYIT|nr:uncharacterized protein PITG_13949 [Phytophthora infestans T30-4]EEY61970.1 conserved hypothetical protein [Phytophthora infestans T30-4]|eukprot:XP_002899610.1 conserved hypothetical protein [Phytophthora infestans T30-4]